MLRDLAEPDRRAVLQATTRRKYRKGDTIFYEGDLGDTLHMIERGHVAVRVSTPAGDVVTLTVLGCGDCFGEQALLNPDDRRTASIIAIDATETLALRRNDFNALRAHHHTVETFLVGVLAATVRRLSAQVLEALYVPVDKRLLRRLVDLVDMYGGDGQQPCSIPITQEDLATMAGTTRPSANRCLHDLVTAGVADLNRGRITINDRAALLKRSR
jgi:CRP/FNR family transcriptional regulator, cyclic AMP receptor protein